MKTAVVTGGTKGLGQALGLALGEAGYTVVALYHSDEEAAERTRALHRERGYAATVERLDITREADAQRLPLLDAISGASELVLVNNACAAFAPRPFHLLSWDDFARELDVGVKGAFFCTRALLQPLVQKRGCVVNVSTRALETPVPKGFSSYVTTKSALRGFTQALAAEYGERGLRVMSVSPGFMETPLTAAWDPRLRAMMTSDATPTETVAGRIALLVTSGEGGRGETHLL